MLIGPDALCCVVGRYSAVRAVDQLSALAADAAALSDERQMLCCWQCGMQIE